ncbi:S24 family peptidase [Persephonella sp.]
MESTIIKKLGKRVRKLRKAKGLSSDKLAELIGREGSFIRRLETGRMKNIPEDIEKIAQALGVSIAELLTTPEEKKEIELEFRTDLVTILVINGVPASGFEGGDTEIIDYLPTPREMLRGLPQERVAWVKVVGDSMEPKVSRGDLVLVADGSWVEVKNGDLVIAVMDGEKTLKRFYDKGNYILLVPENESYEPLMIPKDKLKETSLYLYKVLGILKRMQ